MANSIVSPYGLETNNPVPEIKRYFNLAETPYTNTAQVLSEVLLAVRYKGQTFNVNEEEWWFKEGVADGDLVLKLSALSSNLEGGQELDLPYVDTNTFTLPDNYIVVSVFINIALNKKVRYTRSGNDITILETLLVGDTVNIRGLVATGSFTPVTPPSLDDVTTQGSFTSVPIQSPNAVNNEDLINLGQVEDLINNISIAVDLGYEASDTKGVITNSTGTDAAIPLADETNAGLLSPTEKVKIGNTSNTNSGDETTLSIQTKRPLKTLLGNSLEGIGDITLDTSNVLENTNLYFTTARVLSTVLSGLSILTGGEIISTDSILIAFGKIQNQINLKAPKANPIFTGSVVVPNAVNSNEAVNKSQLDSFAPQKIITGNVTLNDTYHNCIVLVKNTANITIPYGLISGFNCVFDAWSGATATFIEGTNVNVIETTLILAPNKMASLYQDGSSKGLATEVYKLKGELS